MSFTTRTTAASTLPWRSASGARVGRAAPDGVRPSTGSAGDACGNDMAEARIHRPLAGGLSGRVAPSPENPDYRVPVLPNPPSPRAVSGSSATCFQTPRTTGATTACAMRMPRSMVKGSVPAFMTITCSSPR